MTPSHIFLMRRPHMSHLAGHPAIGELSSREIVALEAFMSFCASHGLSDPDEGDVRAFATLTQTPPSELELLCNALRALGLPTDFLGTIKTIENAVEHKRSFKGAQYKGQRKYERVSSLPTSDLPGAWQTTLRRLRIEQRYARSILDRMTHRLTSFAWSATNVNAPIDLGSVEAQKAFYADLRQRSAARNDGQPRWSYLRTAWEELARFSQAHGYDPAIIHRLSEVRDELAERERAQDALKLAKAAQCASASTLLAEAQTMLISADSKRSASQRHIARNRACAIAIGIAVPARPLDVFEQHRFGVGIFHDTCRNAYAFRYRPSKTKARSVGFLNIMLDTHWNRFIDALLLQDHDPRYLPELRAQAFSEKRPLYVNYDGSRCAYSWYSRAWAALTGTGGHIARTLLWDEFADQGALGVEYVTRANHHGATMRDAYSTEISTRAAYEEAHQQMARLQPCDDDISDLL